MLDAARTEATLYGCPCQPAALAERARIAVTSTMCSLIP